MRTHCFSRTQEMDTKQIKEKKAGKKFGSVRRSSYLCSRQRTKNNTLMKQFVLMMTVAALMSSQNVLAQNRVKNLYTEAQTLKVEQVVNTEQTVQVNRYLFAGYNTLCLPMSLTAEQIENLVNCISVRCITIPEQCLFSIFESDLLVIFHLFFPRIRFPP